MLAESMASEPPHSMRNPSDQSVSPSINNQLALSSSSCEDTCVDAVAKVNVHQSQHHDDSTKRKSDRDAKLNDATKEKRVKIRIKLVSPLRSPSLESRTLKTDKSGHLLTSRGDFLYDRYKVLKRLGQGTYGHVVSALDTYKGIDVAIKVFSADPQGSDDFDNERDILHYLMEGNPQKQEAPIMSMLDLFLFKGHCCIVSPLYERSLGAVVHERGTFSAGDVRQIARQLVNGLAFLSQMKVLHGDLKPANIVVSTGDNGEIRVSIIDFGSAFRFTDDDDDSAPKSLATYTHRAPEAFMGLPYGLPHDMWSLGCTLVEIGVAKLKKKPLFMLDRQDEWLKTDPSQRSLLLRQTLLNDIACTVGPPPVALVDRSPEKDSLFASRADCPPHNPHISTEDRSLTTLMKGCDELYRDFVFRCLSWDPSQRLTPRQAQLHKWIAC